MKFDTSSSGGKTPGDGAVLGIALSLQRGNALPQDLHVLNPARQAAPGKNGDLDLRHVEPAPMLGGVMELDPLQNASCFSRLEGFIESGWRMGIQVILHDAHVVGMRVDLVDQPADATSRSQAWSDASSSPHDASRKAVRRRKTGSRCPAAHIRNRCVLAGLVPSVPGAAHRPLAPRVSRQSSGFDSEDCTLLHRGPVRPPSARQTLLLPLECTTARVATA